MQERHKRKMISSVGRERSRAHTRARAHFKRRIEKREGKKLDRVDRARKHKQQEEKSGMWRIAESALRLTPPPPPPLTWNTRKMVRLSRNSVPVTRLLSPRRHGGGGGASKFSRWRWWGVCARGGAGSRVRARALMTGGGGARASLKIKIKIQELKLTAEFFSSLLNNKWLMHHRK